MTEHYRSINQSIFLFQSWLMALLWGWGPFFLGCCFCATSFGDWDSSEGGPLTSASFFEQHDGVADQSLHSQFFFSFASRGLRVTAKITYQAVLLENVVCNCRRGEEGEGFTRQFPKAVVLRSWRLSFVAASPSGVCHLGLVQCWQSDFGDLARSKRTCPSSWHSWVRPSRIREISHGSRAVQDGSADVIKSHRK